MGTRRARILTTAALIVAAPMIALIDLSTGLEVSFSIFYVVPPVVAGWYLGSRVGLAVAIVTGLSWAYAESITRSASVPASLWNRGTRVAVLVAFTYLIDLVHRKQEELRHLLTQRDEFMALVAHELRAPVAAIEILATGIAKAHSFDDRERRALDRLRAQASGLASLAEGLLSVGKLEARANAAERHAIDLRAMLLSLAEASPRLMLTAPMTPIMVVADADVIRRALANVIDNALKFSDAGKAVEVDLRTIDGVACVRVVDRGIGLDRAEVAHLFDKYGRLQAAQSFPGIGLGLYYAQLAVRAHGGAIKASSAGRGAGATFEVRLPLAARVEPGAGRG